MRVETMAVFRLYVKRMYYYRPTAGDVSEYLNAAANRYHHWNKRSFIRSIEMYIKPKIYILIFSKKQGANISEVSFQEFMNLNKVVSFLVKNLFIWIGPSQKTGRIDTTYNHITAEKVFTCVLLVYIRIWATTYLSECGEMTKDKNILRTNRSMIRVGTGRVREDQYVVPPTSIPTQDGKSWAWDSGCISTQKRIRAIWYKCVAVWQCIRVGWGKTVWNQANQRAFKFISILGYTECEVARDF